MRESTEKSIRLAMLVAATAGLAYEFSLTNVERHKWLPFLMLVWFLMAISFGGSKPPADQLVAVDIWRDYAKARGYELIERRRRPFESVFRVIDKSGTHLIGQHNGAKFSVTFRSSETPFRADGSMDTAARSNDSTTFMCEAPWLPDGAWIELSGSYEGDAPAHKAVQAHGMTAFVSPPELIPLFRTSEGEAAMLAFKRLPTDSLNGTGRSKQRGIEAPEFFLSESGFCTDPEQLDRAIDALTLFATLGEANVAPAGIARRAES